MLWPDAGNLGTPATLGHTGELAVGTSAELAILTIENLPYGKFG